MTPRRTVVLDHRSIELLEKIKRAYYLRHGLTPKDPVLIRAALFQYWEQQQKNDGYSSPARP